MATYMKRIDTSLPTTFHRLIILISRVCKKGQRKHRGTGKENSKILKLSDLLFLLKSTKQENLKSWRFFGHFRRDCTQSCFLK